MARNTKPATPLPGKGYEKTVATIERVMATNRDVQVVSPAKLVDKVTGKLREHDVLLRANVGHRTMLVAIECRDRSRKVTVNEVEGFALKCQHTGVDRGVIVSPLGFTEGAGVKAAAMGIDCLRLVNAKSFDWLLVPDFTIKSRVFTKLLLEVIPLPPFDKSATKISLTTLDGAPVPQQQITNALLALAHDAFPGVDDTIGTHRRHMRTTLADVLVRNNVTGETAKDAPVQFTVEYTVTKKSQPLKLMSYTAANGQHVVDAAMVDVEFEEGTAQVVMSQRGDEGVMVTYVGPQTSPSAH